MSTALGLALTMADTTQREEDLRTFREHFESTRVRLSITASPKSVNHVFLAVNISVANNINDTIYLI